MFLFSLSSSRNRVSRASQASRANPVRAVPPRAWRRRRQVRPVRTTRARAWRSRQVKPVRTVRTTTTTMKIQILVWGTQALRILIRPPYQILLQAPHQKATLRRHTLHRHTRLERPRQARMAKGEEGYSHTFMHRHLKKPIGAIVDLAPAVRGLPRCFAAETRPAVATLAYRSQYPNVSY
jgi:hypothetical protein